MSVINIFILQFLYLCLLIYRVSGETCVKSNGDEGECIKISSCPSAVELRKKGGEPKICSFNSHEPIVCCDKVLEREEGPFPPGCTETWRKNVWRPPILGGGGFNSLAREFPHMAALGYDNKNNTILWGCGGTLITTQHVLTAAHCLTSQNTGDLKYVRLGDLNLNSDKDDAQPQNFKVIEFFRHPDYHPPSPYHDLAIIKLDKPSEITSYVIPACLNTKKELPDSLYSAAGWGQLGYGGELADHLQNMIIRIFNHTDCEKAYSTISKRRLTKGIDEETQVCAGAPLVDTCPGDSGGPLQLMNTRHFKDNTVYGVTSFGVACVISSIPGVYIKISPYISWIKSIILP